MAEPRAGASSSRCTRPAALSARENFPYSFKATAPPSRWTRGGAFVLASLRATAATCPARRRVSADEPTPAQSMGRLRDVPGDFELEQLLVGISLPDHVHANIA